MGESTKKKSLRILLTGGGTGGHLFPAIASAQKMQELRPGSQVLFVGTKRKMDKTSLSKYSFQSKSIHSYGLKGKSILEILKALLILPVSCAESLVILLRYRPDVVLGVGGYVTGPVMATAKMIGIPTLIHEQNSIPGLANRKLGSLVDRVCISLPYSDTSFQKEKVVFTGNPVRKEILSAAQLQKKSNEKPVILVLGGSQGAHGVNLMVADAVVSHLGELSKDIKVIHQTGSKDVDLVQEQYQKAGIDAQVAAFFQDMADLYGQADLVVSRAGATTLSELAVMGLPAVLIPYPTAADNHQQKNAEYYARGGGAEILVEKESNSKMLAQRLLVILQDHDKKKAMGKAMRLLGIPTAAEQIVETCLALIPSE